VFGVIAFIYFALRVPETKDRSLEEIERELGAEESREGEDRAQAA
jgi:hypothetical protein